MWLLILALHATSIIATRPAITVPLNTTVTIEGVELSSPLPRCRNTHDTYFMSDPQSCPGYYLCDKGVSTHGECPFGFHFNDKEQICDKPTKVRCSDPECPRRIGFIPWRNSCTQYHLCVQGIVVNDLKCPDGAHFDEALGQCNFPEIVQCGRDVCPQRTDAFDVALQAHPEDCSKCDRVPIRNIKWCLFGFIFFVFIKTNTCSFHIDFSFATII